MTAISFPRSIPDELAVVGLKFMLAPMIELTPLRGGAVIAADLGPTLWRGHWESGELDETEFGIVRAWGDTLQSTQQFLGYDKLREYPLAYPSGWGSLLVSGSPFTGSCKTSSINSDNKRIVLKELPVGFILSAGDYLAFDYATASARALHRVVAGGTASGAGTVTIEVRPFIRTGAAADDVVSLYRPTARMIIMPDSYDEKIVAPTFGSVSFDAIQAL